MQAGRFGDFVKAVDAVNDKMPPARMEGNVERRIGLAHRRDDQLGGVIEPRQIDAKIRQPVLKTERQHALGARANRLGTQ